MPSDLVLGRATEADLADVLALYSQPSFDPGRQLTLPKARERFAAMSRYPDFSLWIVRHQDRAVGSYALLIIDNLAHGGAPSALVENVVVADNWQRRGVGSLMMRHAMSRAQSRGCYKMALSSNRHREAAHAFYRRLGFDQHGHSFEVPLQGRQS